MNEKQRLCPCCKSVMQRATLTTLDGTVDYDHYMCEPCDLSVRANAWDAKTTCVDSAEGVEIKQLTKIDQIKAGDALLISDGDKITAEQAQRVKVSEFDGTEVILNKKQNRYFNVDMYLEGKSWVKDVRVVTFNKV
jgi:hypothetical protein